MIMMTRNINHSPKLSERPNLAKPLVCKCQLKLHTGLIFLKRNKSMQENLDAETLKSKVYQIE